VGASISSGILNEILTLKLESDRMPIETVDFDLEKVLANVTDVISQKRKREELEVLLDLDGGCDRSLRGSLRVGQA
jgi:two-component system sensor histidine kinase/response regulator